MKKTRTKVYDTLKFILWHFKMCSRLKFVAFLDFAAILILYQKIAAKFAALWYSRQNSDIRRAWMFVKKIAA